ncbi:hypothetical protein J6590_053936 [Homalodisca vitripennis]|nr:hypothetical protein J6590_053936 [Homalodisca vitripennis]
MRQLVRTMKCAQIVRQSVRTKHKKHGTYNEVCTDSETVGTYNDVCTDSETMSARSHTRRTGRDVGSLVMVALALTGPYSLLVWSGVTVTLKIALVCDCRLPTVD